jgi:hypothetical protein
MRPSFGEDLHDLGVRLVELVGHSDFSVFVGAKMLKTPYG